MPPRHTELNDKFVAFIEAQKMFFVATAKADGRVNLSPKGMDTLRVLSRKRVVWLSLTGSGNETAAHLGEHDRITMMFCAFEGPALIVRVYGHARVYHPRDPQWREFSGLFPPMAGSRQIIDVEVDLVQSSCGTGVPHYAFKSERGPAELLPFYARMSEAELKAYWQRKNSRSLDGEATNIL